MGAVSSATNTRAPSVSITWSPAAGSGERAICSSEPPSAMAIRTPPSSGSPASLVRVLIAVWAFSVRVSMSAPSFPSAMTLDEQLAHYTRAPRAPSTVTGFLPTRNRPPLPRERPGSRPPPGVSPRRGAFANRGGRDRYGRGHDHQSCSRHGVRPHLRPGAGPPLRPVPGREGRRAVADRGLLLHHSPTPGGSGVGDHRGAPDRTGHPAGTGPHGGDHRDGDRDARRARPGPGSRRHRSRGAVLDGSDGGAARLPADRAGRGAHHGTPAARRRAGLVRRAVRHARRGAAGPATGAAGAGAGGCPGAEVDGPGGPQRGRGGAR